MLIHCTMEELIDIREGRGSLAAREHVDGCDECQSELESLHQRVAALKALPRFNPPRDRWPMVRAQVVANRRRRFFRRALQGAAALAASLMLVVGARAAYLASSDDALPPEVAQLADEAQQLEAVLLELERSNRVMSARVAGAVSTLEDRIAVVDSRLGALREMQRASGQEIIELWRTRVELMDALVRVRAARATQVGF